MRSTFIEHCHVFFSSIRRLLLFDFGSGTVNNGLVGCIFFLYLSLYLSVVYSMTKWNESLCYIHTSYVCCVTKFNMETPKIQFHFYFEILFVIESRPQQTFIYAVVCHWSDTKKKNKHNRRTPKPKCVANKFWLGISIVSCHFFMCLYDVWPQSVANDRKRERERELTVEAHIMFWVSISVIYSNPWLNT